MLIILHKDEQRYDTIIIHNQMKIKMITKILMIMNAKERSLFIYASKSNSEYTAYVHNRNNLGEMNGSQLICSLSFWYYCSHRNFTKSEINVGFGIRYLFGSTDRFTLITSDAQIFYIAVITFIIENIHLFAENSSAAEKW